jgi:hypothetical protein
VFPQFTGFGYDMDEDNDDNADGALQRLIGQTRGMREQGMHFCVLKCVVRAYEA